MPGSRDGRGGQWMRTASAKSVRRRRREAATARRVAAGSAWDGQTLVTMKTWARQSRVASPTTSSAPPAA
jgi:hypothetical protein